MELKTCNNGHIYDPSITPECPECAKMKGKTVPLDGGMDDYGKTEPIHKPTEPVNQGNNGHWAQVDQYGKVPFESEDYTPTRPVGYPSGKEEKGTVYPVTGWLVCVEGAAKGQDFKIHAEYNYIGRGSNMDICIPGDATDSRENHGDTGSRHPFPLRNRRKRSQSLLSCAKADDPQGAGTVLL